MDGKVYRAASNGSWEKLNSEPNWRNQISPIGNTVLHVHLGRPLRLGDANIELIENVLDQEAQWGTQSNNNGDIPLHLAARYGHLKAVEIFVQRAKAVNEEELTRMLRKTNKKKDTALHEAARGGFHKIVKLLVKADPSWPHEANDDKETPLYLAAERGCPACVSFILKNCCDSAYHHKGPCGRTPLHVLVQWRSCTETMSKLLDKDDSVIRLTDDEGSTPLHLAAAENKIKHVKVLLSYDSRTDESAAYIQDKEGRTPLHVATLHFSWDCIRELIKYRPDCIEIVDRKGHNVLHYAAKWACIRRLKVFLNFEHNLSKLMNEKDQNGNTPLHLVAASVPYMSCNCIRHVVQFIKSQQQYENLCNTQNLRAADIVASYDFREHLSFIEIVWNLGGTKHQPPIRGRIAKKSALEDATTVEAKIEKQGTLLKAAAQNQIVVAGLVATVSFAAGFTMPGGFNQNPGSDIGTAVMTNKTAFRAFLISDALAFTLSSIAVLLYFEAAGFRRSLDLVRHLHMARMVCVYSIGAIMIAFLTGAYVVIPHSPRLQTALLIICTLFFFFYASRFLGAPLLWFLMTKRKCPGGRIPRVKAAERNKMQT